MNICFECKHLIRMWPDRTSQATALGKDNYACKASTVLPTCHPVTGVFIGERPSVCVERRVDRKTVSQTFYAICEDINKGDCKLYTPAPKES